MNRKPVIAGNWKMHMTPSETEKFIVPFLRLLPGRVPLDLILAPPFVSLAKAQEKLRGTGEKVALAAQNMFPEPAGAYTGEISAIMLKELDTRWVILGHSERRELFGESDELINRKLITDRKSTRLNSSH